MDRNTVENALSRLINPSSGVFDWDYDSGELVILNVNRENPFSPQLVDFQSVAESLSLTSVRLKETRGKYWTGDPKDLGFIPDGEDLVWRIKPCLIEFYRHDIDLDRATGFYSHISHNPVGRAKSDQTSYMTFLRSLIEQCLPKLPEDREPDFIKALNEAKAGYLRYQNSVYSTAPYSSHIAGGSKFNHRLAARRSSAYDRATDNLIKYAFQAVKTVKEACGIADIERQEEAEKTLSRIRAREAYKQKKKQLKARQNKLPIINDPDHGDPITSDRWKRLGKDYTSVNVHSSGFYRYRSAMIGGGLGPVYLTDKKQTLISDVLANHHETTAPALSTPAHS